MENEENKQLSPEDMAAQEIDEVCKKYGVTLTNQITVIKAN